MTTRVRFFGLRPGLSYLFWGTLYQNKNKKGVGQRRWDRVHAGRGAYVPPPSPQLLGLSIYFLYTRLPCVTKLG